MGDEHGHLRRVVAERIGDLLGREHEAAGSVEDEVDRGVVRRHPDRAEDRLGVLDVDEAEERDAEEADGLLTVDERDYACPPRALERRERPYPPQREEAPADRGKENEGDEDEREDVAEVHRGARI